MTRPNLQRAIEFAIVLGVLVVGVTLCRRGIILSDEGYVLTQALDMARGKVLYRDMDSFVAPGVWFLLAAIFRVVEPTVLASRVPAFVCYLVMVGASVRIADRVAGRTCALATAVGLGVAAVWAFPAWTMSFYSPYAVMFALVALERLVAWQERARGRDLVWTGVALGFAMLFKQNYGVFATVGCGLTVVLSALSAPAPRAGRLRAMVPATVRLALGILVPLVPAGAYLVRHGAVQDAFDALVMHPFRGFLGAHTIPYLRLGEIVAPDMMAGAGRFTYGAYPMVKTGLHLRWPDVAIRGVEQLHVLLYWLPPALFLVAAMLVLRSLARRALDRGLLAVLLVAGFVFLGVFPRADFNHLVNVYQPIVVLGAVVGARLLSMLGSQRRRLVVGTLMGVVAVPYAAVGAIWFLSLFSLLSTPLASPRGGVMVDPWEAGMIDFEVKTIRDRTTPEEAVLTVPGLAMLNFLAEREMPSRYYNLYAVHIAHDGGAGVVEGAERLGTRVAVVDSNNFFSDPTGLSEYAPVLADYLRRYFAPVGLVAMDKHLVLERRAVPLPERTLTTPLAECDLPRDEFPVRAVRQHLFFESLYHYIRNTDGGASGAAPQVLESACTVHVPAAAHLRVRIGYRQPAALVAYPSLIAEVRVREGDDSHVLLRDRLYLEPVGGWQSPAPLEYLVDLGHLAGRDVILEFRTIFDGHVKMNPLELWGFAMVWQDPQIESGDNSLAPVDRDGEVRKVANP